MTSSGCHRLHRRRRAAQALSLAVVLSARCVLAEPHDPEARPTSESGPVDTEQVVKELMRRGVAEYRKGHLEAARGAFARAFALKEHAAIAATLAEVETKLGHYRPAAAHFAFYLEHLPAEREGERKEVEAALAECRRHLGTLRVEVDAATARVTLDGDPIAPSPVDKLWVEPGEHTLAAESEQGADRIVISVAAGELKTAVLHTLTPASSSAPEPEPSATPLGTVTARASNTEQPRHERTETGARSAVLITGVAAATAAAIVGTTFTVLSIRAGNSADKIDQRLDQSATGHMLPPSSICAPAMPPAGCSELAQKRAEQERNEKIAIGSFVAAGGLAVFTAGAYFLWPASNKPKASAMQQRWAFAPWFSTRGAGIELSLAHD